MPDQTAAELQQLIATLRAERAAAAAREAALAEVLNAINASNGDPQPVFQLILEKSHALCGADIGALFLFDGTHFFGIATHGYTPEIDAAMRRKVILLAPFVEQLRSQRVLLADDLANIATPGSHRALAVSAGARSHMILPLRKDNTLLGYIAANRLEVRPFNEADIALLESFAAQAVIAIENARLVGELTSRTADLEQSLEYQTATSDVLNVISRTTFDLQPTLQTVIETATRLTFATAGTIWLTVPGGWRWGASANPTPEYVEVARNLGTVLAGESNSSVATAIRERRIVHIEDVETIPDYPQSARASGPRTVLTAPLLRDGEVLGAITVYRRHVQLFSAREIDLLATFAAQAVIAIENTRLLTEQREALERQTASAEILRVINESPGNLQPVFDTIVEQALRLCAGACGSLATYRGDETVTHAARGWPDALRTWISENRNITIAGGPRDRVLTTKRTVHVIDLRDEPIYPIDPAMQAGAELGGMRTVVMVPLLSDQEVIGVISISRLEVRAFADKEIALLESFAAQAVIALENTRLLTEQREALDRQTATAEILATINASPGDPAPVFEVILEKAHSLCNAPQGSLQVYDGETFRAVATRGMPETFAEYLRQPRLPSPGILGMPNDRTTQVVDLKAHLETHPDDELLRSSYDDAGVQTHLRVPLLRDGRVVGRIIAVRRHVEAFTDKQIALLESFAAQAVIAMENARLLTEQREALERQTATTEILATINANPGNPQPVFQVILEKAMTLCGVAFGALYDWDGAVVRPLATRGLPDAFATYIASRPVRSDPAPLVARVLATRQTLEIPDVLHGEGYLAGHADPVALAELGGARTNLIVPLCQEETAVGYFSLYRQEVRTFSGREIALLESFAAQAVIAIENARLLTEQREALERQTATADILRVINESPGNLAPVFDAMLERAMYLCGAAIGALMIIDGDQIHTSAMRGMPEAFVEFRNRHPATGMPGTPSARVIATRRPVNIADLTQEELYKEGQANLLAFVELAGARAMVMVPLLHEGSVVGFFTILRNDPGAFTDKQISLLESFAAQAVIAMENARLLTEQREALERQTATAEILATINANPGNLQPVFEAVLDSSLRLTGSSFGGLSLCEPGRVCNVARRGTLATDHFPFNQWRNVSPRSGVGRVAAGERYVHIPDLMDTDEYRAGEPGRVQTVESGLRTALWIGLRTEIATIGMILLYRKEPRPFTDKQIALLESFAAQAVIAMENARLLGEIRAARDAAEAALADLKRAQDRLIQSEKMASLGQLTAGIAHEIKNPLNFVNNFADLSTELLDELTDAIAANDADEIADLTATLKSNLQKVVQHGKRADGIVKNMLLHSRESGGERREVDLNTTVEEALNLAYHGARAEKPGFNNTLERHYDPAAGTLPLYPQEFTRVLINLIGNGFYAATKRQARTDDPGFAPTLSISTEARGQEAIIRIRDNGTGMPDSVKARIFEPFFTTKPPGEGTGLGLSLSHDIIVKQHHGSIAVESAENQFTEFTITLPIAPA